MDLSEGAIGSKARLGRRRAFATEGTEAVTPVIWTTPAGMNSTRVVRGGRRAAQQSLSAAHQTKGAAQFAMAAAMSQDLMEATTPTSDVQYRVSAYVGTHRSDRVQPQTYKLCGHRGSTSSKDARARHHEEVAKDE